MWERKTPRIPQLKFPIFPLAKMLGSAAGSVEGTKSPPWGGQDSPPTACIYIYIYGPHLISWADILNFRHFLPSFIVKNAPILQPTNCGCKFVFLFSSSSLLLPFSALFFLFPLLLSISKPQNCPPTEVCGYIYIYICICWWVSL